jgi:hypothetical protein
MENDGNEPGRVSLLINAYPPIYKLFTVNN